MTEDVDRLGKCFKRSLQTNSKSNVSHFPHETYVDGNDECQ